MSAFDSCFAVSAYPNLQSNLEQDDFIRKKIPYFQ